VSHAEVGMLSELLCSDAMKLALWFMPFVAAPFVASTMCVLAGIESVLLLPGVVGALVWLLFHAIQRFFEAFGAPFVSHTFVFYAPDVYFAGLAILVVVVAASRSGAVDWVACALDSATQLSVEPENVFSPLRRSRVNIYGWHRQT
jgi:hypothetical protein